MRTKSWAAVATGAMLFASLATGAGSASGATIAFHYVNYKSGRCLSLEGGGSTSNGAHAIIYDCNIEHEQYWAAYDSGELHNSKSGKCLSTAGGGGTANGTEVIQWTCNGGLEQQWIRSGYQWVNVKAEKCLSTAGGGGTSNNTRTVIWDCNTADEMHWTTYN